MEQSETLPLKFTWEGALNIILAILESPTQAGDAKAVARKELRRMAQLADRCAELNKGES